MMQDIKITIILMKTYKGLQQQSYDGPSQGPAHLEIGALIDANLHQ